MGVSYKSNICDLRESPALSIYELYTKSGAIVEFYDPHAQSFRDAEGHDIQSVNYDLTHFKNYDCMVLITNHSEFNYEELAALNIPILDTRNAFGNKKCSHIFKLGAPVKNTDSQKNEIRMMVKQPLEGLSLIDTV